MTIVTTRPELSISPEKVCFIIAKAREFDLQDLVIDEEERPLDASVRSDDENLYDPTIRELRGFINALSADEQIDLVALTWLGRGDGGVNEWNDLRAEAARAHNNRTAAYFLAKPFLPGHLEEGLLQFGCSCEDF